MPIRPDSTSAIEMLVGSEHGKVLEECFAQLEDDHCRVILMRDFLRTSWQHIQRELGADSEESVRALRRLALVKISGLLRERGIGQSEE